MQFYFFKIANLEIFVRYLGHGKNLVYSEFDFRIYSVADDFERCLSPSGDIKMLMKKIVFGLVVMCLACTATLVAQDVDEAVKKKKSPAKKATAKLMKSFKKANLTDEQKADAKAIVGKHLEAYMAAKKAADDLLTEDQITLEKAAMKKGRTDGLKGKELDAVGLAAMGLSEAQQASYVEANKNLKSISKTVQTEILALLTDEQKAALPKQIKGKKNKGDKKKKKKGKKGKKKKDKEEDVE